MAEEPRAKCHHAETSDQSSNLDDVHIPREKCEYTRTLTGVELHGKETLEIICTSEPDKADEMMGRLGMKGGGLYPSFIEFDVEYTRTSIDGSSPPVMRGGTLLGVPHRSGHRMPKRLKEFLQEQNLYNFVGFSIKGDKEKLEKSGLEINPKNFIDIQRNWRVPGSGKESDSLDDVAAILIHPFYKGMKKKIDKQEDHKLWGISPLPEKLIEYAGIDAYATYKSWKIINNVKTGLQIMEAQKADPYYHCHYAG